MSQCTSGGSRNPAPKHYNGMMSYHSHGALILEENALRLARETELLALAKAFRLIEIEHYAPDFDPQSEKALSRLTF